MNSPLAVAPELQRDDSRLSFQIKTALIVLAVVASIAAGYAFRHHHRYRHVATHEAGKVYRSGWVDPALLKELIERHGIRTVINLCPPGTSGEHQWDLEREAVRQTSARLLELPMPLTVAEGREAIATHLDAIRNPDNYPMLVHCQNGVSRTSQFVALYDMTMHGLSAEEALARQEKYVQSQNGEGIQEFCRQFEQQYGPMSQSAGVLPASATRH